MENFLKYVNKFGLYLTLNFKSLNYLNKHLNSQDIKIISVRSFMQQING